MEVKVFKTVDGVSYGATILVTDGLVTNVTESKYGESIAFVRRYGGRWRTVEWFIVPDDVKTSLFSKAVKKARK